MCSSRLDRESGIVTITTPACWCEVGHRLYTLAAADTYGVDHADWCLRLLRPQAPPSGARTACLDAMEPNPGIGRAI
jgi:hypothetical protein